MSETTLATLTPAQVDAAEARHAAAGGARATMSDKLEREAWIYRLEESAADVPGLIATVREQQARIAALEGERPALVAMQPELGKLRSEFDRLESERDDWMSQSQGWQKQWHDLEAKNRGLQNERDAARRQALVLRENIDDLLEMLADPDGPR